MQPKPQPWLQGAAFPARGCLVAQIHICCVHCMSDPVIASMAQLRSQLVDVLDRARRDETPTVITRRSKQDAVVIDIAEYRRLSRRPKRLRSPGSTGWPMRRKPKHL
ncbi:type II toxin-antitoxin system Phd/YefM family antitoxin [Kitasatospora sp. NPDC057223]|uniref:type II toxin-antitoxin system Phd/YefM family antitoxin n=1 Tax=Kitasatospora sp. NPDC057223 TaxID=3346055 RepID=UPI003625B54C